MRFWLLGLAFLFLPLSIIQDFRENLVIAETGTNKDIPTLKQELKNAQTAFDIAKTKYDKNKNNQKNFLTFESAKTKLKKR